MEKFLFQPVKPFVIKQAFGDNKVCIDNKTNSIYIPCNGDNPPDGYRSIYSQMKGHNGIDLAAAYWQPCYASQDGVVEEVQLERERGLGVGIVTDKKYFCAETKRPEYFKYRNWHFEAIYVKKGDKVKTGDLIGWCGSTGYSTGSHDHLELKPVEWYSYRGEQRIRNILQDNGYFGAVNPIPYMEDIFALEFAGLWKRVKEAAAILADYLSDLARK